MNRRSVVALLAALLLSGCSKRSDRPNRGGGTQGKRFVTISQEQHATWIRNFNPLLLHDTTRWPTPAGIYEPLLIFNAVKGEYVPWLATAHVWSADALSLTFEIRKAVLWSDGVPFTPRDVAFTFELLKKHRALDLHHVWSYLAGVDAGPDRVMFRFQRPYVPGLFRIGQQPIVPEHIWKDVPDPVRFKNETPVATGPFTEVVTFQGQLYELGKNPRYWQPGKPMVDGLRFPAFPNNEQAHMALLSGETDWGGNFIPDIERLFVARDPEHHGYWFPRMGGMVSLFLNTTRPPFDEVRVRKALSLAVDRDKVTKTAMYGYTRPADASGQSDAFKSWRDVVPRDRDWTRLDRDAAKKLLDEAGYVPGPDGIRVDARGTRLEFEVNVVSGWADWVRAVQLLTHDLAEIGVSAKIRAYDYAAWFRQLQSGEFNASIGVVKEGPTPYEFYRFVMSSASKEPVGSVSSANYHRFGEPRADALFAEFERATDVAEQMRLAKAMQSLFVELAPIVPLFPSASWGISNTKRFVGFPSAKDPYARLSPFMPPEYLLVLVNLRPR